MSRNRLAREAVPEMVATVMADDDLREAIFSELIEDCCLRFLQGAASTRHLRQKRIGGAPRSVPEQRSSNLDAWAGAVANSLLEDFRLPSGKRFGDATRADLEAAMAAYRMQADDAEIKHRWLRLVKQGLTEGQRVRDRYDDERLAELRAEARKVEP